MHFISVTFKSHTKWNNAHVSTLTSTILPTIGEVGICHILNCFRHGIYMMQTSTYKILQNFWLTQVLTQKGVRFTKTKILSHYLNKTWNTKSITGLKYQDYLANSSLEKEVKKKGKKLNFLLLRYELRLTDFNGMSTSVGLFYA